MCVRLTQAGVFCQGFSLVGKRLGLCISLFCIFILLRPFFFWYFIILSPVYISFILDIALEILLFIFIFLAIALEITIVIILDFAIKKIVIIILCICISRTKVILLLTDGGTWTERIT